MNTAPKAPGQKRALLRQARSQQTRATMISAAQALWRARPYDAVTVADICAAAGIGVGGFYFHFERKEDLVLEVALGDAYRACEFVYDELVQVDEPTTAVVYAILRTLSDELARVPVVTVAPAMLEAYRVMGRSSSDTHIESLLFRTFVRTFRRAKRRGEFSDGDRPDDAAVIVTTVAQQSILAWGIAGGGSDLYAPLARYTELVLRTVVDAGRHNHTTSARSR